MMLSSSVCFNSLSGVLESGTLTDAVSCAPSWGVFVSAALFMLSAIVNLVVSLKPVELPLEEKPEDNAEKSEEKETANA